MCPLSGVERFRYLEVFNVVIIINGRAIGTGNNVRCRCKGGCSTRACKKCFAKCRLAPQFIANARAVKTPTTMVG